MANDEIQKTKPTDVLELPPIKFETIVFDTECILSNNYNILIYISRYADLIFDEDNTPSCMVDMFKVNSLSISINKMLYKILQEFYLVGCCEILSDIALYALYDKLSEINKFIENFMGSEYKILLNMAKWRKSSDHEKIRLVDYGIKLYCDKIKVKTISV